MSSKERLIAQIHHEQDVLSSLITFLGNNEDLTKDECSAYEVTTKEIEKNLKRLRCFALDELIKEINTQQNFNTIREEILE